MNQRAPDFAIGSTVWPGLAKLTEECGELLQVAGKLMAFPDGAHPDGAGDLVERLLSELADVGAVVEYVVKANHLDHDRFFARMRKKVARFVEWHAKERGGL